MASPDAWEEREIMTWLFIAIIAFFLFELSLCIAAGRADESAERLESRLSQELIAQQKRTENVPIISDKRRPADSSLAAQIENDSS